FLLTTSAGEVSFNFDSDHWLDVDTFEEKVKQGMAEPPASMTPAHAQALEEAQQLYSGELLEDCYGDWVFRERERLNLLYLNSLARLMRYHELHDHYNRSLGCGQKILAIDPLREQVHRHIMRLYLRNGQRALAAQQYEICRQVLADELGIRPMVETQALYDQIVTTSVPRASTVEIAESRPGSLQRALGQLKAAMRNLDQAQAQLQQARQTFSRLTASHPDQTTGPESDNRR
ncbi:MAG: bacterial transcriptional activator domain-containing protein, partial [Anaerolineales bacterium]